MRDATATFVPVETGVGEGTDHGHWDELTTVTDQWGRMLADELFTGFTGPGPNEDQFFSNTTAQSFRDLGYKISYTAIPEASLIGLLQLAGLALLVRRRR